MTSLSPGAVIGILGGGQLGRMLAGAASQLGFDVHVFCPEADSPAARVAMKHWEADYDDDAALTGFASACDVITLEFENIPVSAVEAIAATGTPLHPGARSLSVPTRKPSFKVSASPRRPIARSMQNQTLDRRLQRWVARVS